MSSGPEAEGVLSNNQRGRGSGPCRLWGGLDKARHIVQTDMLVRVQRLRNDMYKAVKGPSKRPIVLSMITGSYWRRRSRFTIFEPDEINLQGPPFYCEWFLSIDNSVRRLLMLKIVLHSLFADAIDCLRPDSPYPDPFWLISGCSICIKNTFFPFRTGLLLDGSEYLGIYRSCISRYLCCNVRILKNRGFVRHMEATLPVS